MKFAVIGDSWAGVCEYNQGVVENLLNKAGHSSIILASSGSCNHGQLQNLQYELLEKDKVDYIIWFHTEPARDYNMFISMAYTFDNTLSPYFSDLPKKNLVDDLHFLNTQNYQYAQDLYEKYHIPFVVIGGAGPLSPTIENFNFYKFKVDAWNKEISEFDDIPLNSYTHHVVKMLDHNKSYKSRQALEEIEKTDKLEVFMRTDLEKYPDTAHPNVDYYPDLLDRMFNCLGKEQ